MNLNTFMKRMPGYYQSRKCIYITSPPGRGKTTTIVRAPEIIGKALGLNLGVVIVNGGLLTPMATLGFGLPKHYENHSEMVFSDPFFWRTEEGKRLEEYDGGIIFIDEADKMDTDTKKNMGEGALSGRLGPHRLPKGWVIWMAGNTAEHRSGSTKELDHLINRRRQIEITDDVEATTEWMVTNGVSTIAIAFTNQHPEIVFTDKVPEKQGPWCTPRSLVEADRYMQILQAQNGGRYPDDPTTLEEIAGDIGHAAAVAYFAFIRLELDLPKFEDIVANPTKTKIPKKPDAQMLCVFNLAARVTAKTLQPIVEYIEGGETGVPEKGMSKEFAITFAKAACKRCPELVIEPAMRKWSVNNASLMAQLQA